MPELATLSVDPSAGSGDLSQGHLLPARALGDAGWTHDPSPAAGGDRGSFRPRTAALRADAVPSGSIDAAPSGGVASLARRGDLQASVATPADRQTRKLRRRGAGRPSRRAADVAVCVG